MIILALSMVIIIYICVKGWQIALTDKLHEDAEHYAEQRYLEHINNTRYKVHIKQRIVDEMRR
ncbi:MAG: hypothetical protein MJY71_08095 [Bacteroidaceae bacterium]|nr:hypothetical protein [Bacteroidaceae bacterium]